MRHTTAKIPFKRGELTAETFWTGCWHIGSPSHHEEGLETFIEQRKADKRLWTGMGDMGEFKGPRSRHFSGDTHKETILSQVDCIEERIRRIGKTCIGLAEGNHETSASKQSGVGNISRKIAQDCNVMFLTRAFRVTFECPRGQSCGFFAHPSRNLGNSSLPDPEQREIAAKRALRRFLSPFDANIKGIFHWHRAVVCQPIYEHRMQADDGTRRPSLVGDPQWCFSGQSLFKNYDESNDESGYGEAALFRPTELGWIGVVFNRDASIAAINAYNERGTVSRTWEPKIVDH